MPSHATIFADGNPCAPGLSRRLRQGRYVILLDGAAERVRREGWLPHLIAGDFDSVSKATLRHFEKKGVELLPTPDQDHTDLEKAIAWCALRGFRSIWVAQAVGSRLDHSFGALALLRRYHHPERELLLFEGKEAIRFARDEKLILNGKEGRPFAILPFPACRVHTKGLAYELAGLELGLGVRESISNHALKKRITLEIEGEAIVVEGA